MAPFEVSSQRIAAAVSGGPDSTALAHLLSNWASVRGVELVVLTVDHGLRIESAREAEAVQKQWGGRVLKWEGPKPSAGIMEAARAARYDLLIRACREMDVSHLFLAHHLDDQAETILFRLARGSGWRGCVGMPMMSARAGIKIARPLLSVSKTRLVETCRGAGIEYFEDPSNESPKFSRVQIRAGMKMFSEHELGAEELVESSAVDAARRQAEIAQLRSVPHTILPGGAYMGEITRASHLGMVLALVGQAAYPAKGDDVAALWTRGEGTLGGARAQKLGDEWLVSREALGRRMPIELFAATYWDRRFAVRLQHTFEGKGCVVGPLKDGAWRARGEDVRWFAELPGRVRASYPAIWRGDELVAVPGVFGAAEAVWAPWRDPFQDMFA